MNKNVTCAAALAVITYVLAGLSSPAEAQSIPGSPPPLRDYIDVNGVDLISLQFNLAVTEVSIGRPGAGGMAYTRSLIGSSWVDGYTGTIFGDGTTYRVSVGRKSQNFTKSGSTFAPAEGQGSSLSFDAGTQTYTFTSADGVVSTFDNTISIGYAQGMITSTTYPSGERIDFHYLTATACVPPDCTVSATVRRLQSVTNNFGYQIRFNYAAGGTSILHDQVESWYQRTGVVGINTAVDYCNPAADACGGFTETWPAVTYGYPSTNVQTVTDLLGRTTTYVFGNPMVIRLPSNPSVDSITITKDANGLVTQVTAASGTWHYQVADPNTNQRWVTVTDPSGSTRTVYSFVPTSLVYSDKNGAGKTTSFTYDDSNRLRRMTFPEGGYVEYTYDGRGNVTQTKQVSKTPNTPADIITSAGYEAGCSSRVTCNKPIHTIDARGGQTDYTYDPVHGGLLTVTDPPPESGAARPQTRYTYTPLFAWYKSSSGTVTQAPTPVYLLTQASTCATLASCIGAADEVRTSIGYGAAGVANNRLPTSQTMANGTGALSASSTSTYDAIGNLITVDGPLAGNGDTTHFRYDAARRQIGIVSPDPDGPGPLNPRAVRNTFNAVNLVTTTEQGSVADSSSTAWNNFIVLAKQTMSYDDLGRLTQRAAIAVPGASAAAVTQYSYDAESRLRCVAVRMNPAVFGSLPDACTHSTAGDDGSDRITHYEYDGADRLTKVTSGYAVATPIDVMTVTYTDDGLRSTVADGEGRLSTFEYDGLNRLKRLRYPVPNGVLSSSATDYDEFYYDAASNLTEFRRRDDQRITFTYDALNRVKTKSPPVVADAVTYSYDNFGRLLSAVSPGQSVGYTYDALGRVINQTSPQGTWVSGWDVGGRRTRLTWPDGFYVDYDYDNLGAMKTIRENGATSGAGVLATYTYDNLGRRTSIVRGNGVTTAFGYDAISRLNSMTQDLAGTAYDQTFTFTYNAASQIRSQSTTNGVYDWNGTLLNTGYDLNGLNQVVKIGETDLQHDSRGNLRYDGSRTYDFDVENRLTVVSGGSSASLSYDPVGRLYETTGATSTQFAYDGTNVAAEYQGSSTPAKRYVFGPGVDEALVWYEGGSTSDRRWMVTDPRGSVTAVADGSGAAMHISRYDDYGRPGASNVGRFQYTGQMWLPEAGLYHYKARAYQPALGRFLQTDPIGYSGGLNLYAYVGGDPINMADPTGLCTYATQGVDPDGVAWVGGGIDCNINNDATFLAAILIGDSGATYGAGGSNGGGGGGQGPQGPQQVRKSEKASCSPPAFMNDLHVVKELNMAWLQSNPYASPVPYGQPGSIKVEQGGWIFRSSITGDLGVIRVVPGTRDSLDRDVLLAARPFYLGAVLGWFHTHPNTAAEGYYDYGPSRGDIIITSVFARVPGVIKTHGGDQYVCP